MKLRFRKNDPDHNLLAAVQHYIEAHSGALVVVGGVEVITYPGDRPHNFRIAVRCTGTPPKSYAELDRKSSILHKAG